MTESPYALAHDFALMVPAPDGVDAAIAEVMSRHEAELDEALRPFGVALVDLLQPTWMRAVRVGDVEALRSPAQAAADAARGAMAEGIEVGKSLLAERGCCGSGEACSSPACTGTPSAPAVDGVYMTDQLRESEGFGERIDDGEACDPEACAGGCSRGGWVAPRDVAPPAEGEPIPEVGMVHSPRSSEVFPEPRQDAAVFGAPRVSDRAPMYGGRDEDGL